MRLLHCWCVACCLHCTFCLPDCLPACLSSVRLSVCLSVSLFLSLCVFSSVTCLHFLHSIAACPSSCPELISARSSICNHRSDVCASVFYWALLSCAAELLCRPDTPNLIYNLAARNTHAQTGHDTSSEEHATEICAEDTLYDWMANNNGAA